MKLLIEIEGPGADRPVPGEPMLVQEINAFVYKLIQQRAPYAVPSVAVLRLDDDVVPVKAEELLRLQKRLTAVANIVAEGKPGFYRELREALR